MVQVRKVVRELYPDQFGIGRKPIEVPKRRFLRRFADRRLRQVGTRLAPVTRKRLLYALTLVLFVIAAWAFIYYYNKFLTGEYEVSVARAQIDVQLQRRKDIITSLKPLILAYAEYEKKIVEHAANTRKEIMRPAPPDSAKESPSSGLRLPIPGGNLDASLGKLVAVAEAFPALRLSEDFQRMMDALVEVDTKLAEQRMLHNARCNDQVTYLNVFPGFLFNRILRFQNPTFYEPDDNVLDRISFENMPK